MNRNIIVLAIFYIVFFGGIMKAQDLSFYTKNDEYDAVRLPLIYPYELWCTNDKNLVNWTFNSEIKLGIYGNTQKIFIKDHFIILFVDKFIDCFDNKKIIPSSYYIIDTEKKKKKKIDSIQNLNIYLKELGITEYKLESIKDLLVEYMKTGICYWFPEDIKEQIVEKKAKK
jgi:hypothetical protein